MSRRNWAFDIALAAVVGVLGQLEVWWGIGSTHRQGPLWVQSLLYAVTALLLVGRRVRPLACLTAMVVVSVVEFVAVGSPEGFGVSVAPLIATYTVGNRLEWRRSWVGLALSVVVWVAWAVFDPMNTTFAERLVVVGLAGPVDHRVAAGRARTGHAAERRAATRQPRAAGVTGRGRGAQPDRPRAARRDRAQRQRHDGAGVGGASPAHARAGGGAAGAGNR